MITITLATSKKTKMPVSCGPSGARNECAGVMNQNLAANNPKKVATADGPTPQNNAEKARAGNNVMYGKESCTRGVRDPLAINATSIAATAAP